MDDPLQDNCAFHARYTVAWAIWAGGYPTQDQALTIATAREGELTSLLATSLRSATTDPLTIELSWQVGEFQAIRGLHASYPAPNSLVLTITVLAASPGSVGGLDRTRTAVAVQDLARVISDWVKQRMPGATRGANLYDVVVEWTPGPALFTAGEPALGPDQPVAVLPTMLKVYYRRGLTLGQLRQLARSPRNGGEDMLDTYYGWRHERAVTVVKGMGGSALSLLAAWLVPFLKNEYAETPSWLVLGPPLLVILALAVWSLVAITRIDRIHASYATAAALLQSLRP